MHGIHPKRLVDTPKKRVVTEIAILALVIVSAASAAWFAGLLTGAAAGHTAGAQSVGQLTFIPGNAGDVGLVQVAPGVPGSAIFDVSNPSSIPLTVTTATAGAITASNSCDTTGIHFDASKLVGRTFAPGLTSAILVANEWTADASTSTACQNTTLAVQLSGTTAG
jgi:hypothetical protein